MTEESLKSELTRTKADIDGRKKDLNVRLELIKEECRKLKESFRFSQDHKKEVIQTLKEQLRHNAAATESTKTQTMATAKSLQDLNDRNKEKFNQQKKIKEDEISRLQRQISLPSTTPQIKSSSEQRINVLKDQIKLDESQCESEKRRLMNEVSRLKLELARISEEKNRLKEKLASEIQILENEMKVASETHQLEKQKHDELMQRMRMDNKRSAEKSKELQKKLEEKLKHLTLDGPS